jgi:hypothetical protein
MELLHPLKRLSDTFSKSRGLVTGPRRGPCTFSGPLLFCKSGPRYLSRSHLHLQPGSKANKVVALGKLEYSFSALSRGRRISHLRHRKRHLQVYLITRTVGEHTIRACCTPSRGKLSCDRSVGWYQVAHASPKSAQTMGGPHLASPTHRVRSSRWVASQRCAGVPLFGRRSIWSKSWLQSGHFGDNPAHARCPTRPHPRALAPCLHAFTLGKIS